MSQMRFQNGAEVKNYSHQPYFDDRRADFMDRFAQFAVIAARDFGWLGTHDAVERLEATLATMKGLERFRGHFYNWYNTHDLLPLDPQYVSSVDSGNLAGHLLTLACGLRGLAEEKILDPQIFSGLRDTLALVKQSSGENALLSQLDVELVG